MRAPFSWHRAFAVLLKEFVQMRRDRSTFAMMVGVPVMQMLLFGYAINMDPKHLPTALHDADNSAYARSIEAALANSGYFSIERIARSPAEASAMLDRGDVAFAITIPADFTRKLVRGERPQILIEADASDPSAASNALAAMATLGTAALAHDLVGPMAARASAPAFDTVVQRRYNPEGITAYNIVPGLLGVVLTMTMVMITSIAMTRERERGTMENLLAMPARPLEVMFGKIVPFLLIGSVQVTLVLLLAHFVFGVPMVGSLALLAVAITIFIVANLAVGFTFSTFAHTQLQALQSAVFFLMPSILLSGFAFPFRGMPEWAQWIGTVLPNTHFLRAVRGILLKGNGWTETWPHLWPILIFLLVAGTLALFRYRRTLD